MNPARERRTLELFAAALDLPDDERSAWLAEACDGDIALHQAVRQLLGAHARSGPLDAPPLVVPPPSVEAQLHTALAGIYEVRQPLGQGGMAAVFLARELKHDRLVVLKVLEPSVAAAGGAERFLREVRIAARLAHPAIVPFIDSGEVGGLLYYVMPFIEGETLRDRLRRDGPLAPATAVPLLHEIASALNYAHGQGFVHRDLKPENVLVVEGHARLLDFGIAMQLIDGSGDALLTPPGAVMGTRRYMAPEQAAGNPDMDRRVDVYAWGVLAYELCTGMAPEPLQANSRRRADLQHLMSAPLAALICDCLALLPGDRPPDMRSVLERLESAPVRAEGVSVPAPRRTSARASLIAALLVVLGVTAAVAWKRRATAGEGLLQAPVAVGVLRNETSDTSLASLGRLAGDWITAGLQESGRAAVVPWGVALDLARDSSRDVRGDAAWLQRQTGARTLVTGAIYRIGDSLRFQVQLTDGSGARLLAAPIVVAVPRAAANDGVHQLRQRVTGVVAGLTDARLSRTPGLLQQPPSYEAYREFDRGLTRFLAQEYGAAAADFRAAWSRDTTFAAALVYAAKAHWNDGEPAAADSLAQEARRREGALGTYQELWLRFIEAVLRGDDQAALVAMRRAVQLAPGSRAGFDLAVVALEMGQPAEALGALQQLDPDRGEMRGWSSYWTQLAHAQHLLGRHEEELAAAREQQRRHPDRGVARVLAARALAALGRTAALDSAAAVWLTLPPDAYWSYGGALVIAAEEFAHRGDAATARGYFERAEGWLAEQLRAAPEDRAHRYWRTLALEGLGRAAEARLLAESLARDYPERVRYRGMAAVAAARAGDSASAERWLGLIPAYGRGEYTAFQARIAAVGGDRERAFSLLATALGQGVDGLAWLHGYAGRDFASLRGDPRYAPLLGLAREEGRAASRLP